MAHVTPLRRIRLELGLKLVDVAGDVDCDPTLLGRIETGKRTPNRRLARALYRYYNGRVDLGLIYDATFGAD